MKVWSNNLEDLEQKFLACEAAQPSIQQPPNKRTRKRKLEQKPNQEENLEMAKLAASLQIAHFHKVHSPKKCINCILTLVLCNPHTDLDTRVCHR